MFQPFPADINSWIAFYIQRRHAATILYITYDKQLILIYAFPGLSHIKLQLYYGQWQVKYSKPDWIWQQPETQPVKFPSKTRDSRCLKPDTLPTKITVAVKVKHIIEGLGELNYLHTWVCINNDTCDDAIICYKVPIDQAVSCRNVLLRGENIGVQPGSKTPP